MKDAPDPVKQLESLIEHFEQNLYTLKSTQYNETQARREFIDPFFTLLGWDMDNRQGYAEAYKDVIHEDAIKVGGYTKAPDYCFRIGGTRKFFVEAKKPSVNLKDDPEPAYQLRRYAWSAKLPLSILTDFEELAVYDCRIKPSPTDKASAGRVRYLNYRDYAKEWESLASVFSREAVLKGSFDKYAESEKAKRGTTEVDKAFLLEIEAWRDALARNLALRNPNLTTRELNFAVQVTIDRLIFLRICEDRGVEDYARLMALQNGPEVYPRLMALFRSAGERYNSGLFHFESEKGREAHDTMTPGLTIDDKVLKDILKGLYYPDSPYEFSVLPADILGQVYEQFLGKVIRLTAGHQAKVEDKPEVKKAGGVYYTPTYIVDYIVKNTVGTMLGSRVKGQGESDESGLRGKGQGSSQEGNNTNTLNPNPFTLGPVSMGVRDGDQELSRTNGLAEGDGPSRVDLPSGETVSEGRDLCSQQSDQEGGCLDPIQHCGGIRKDPQGGLSSPSLDRARLSDGSANAARHSLAAQVSGAGVREISAGASSRSRKNADAHDTRSSKSSTLAPLPFTLRILDPACGSGSFLLGAYQYLLTWYRDRFVEDGAEKWAKGKEPRLYQAADGEWKLTTSERKRILLNHIYGVDIDAQAVEVTKLSLLLKVLEGETKESVSIQRRLFHERALPDLSRNIKCGNSLIGSDFYKGEQGGLFGDEAERDRINAFDWEDEFPEVFGKLGSRVKGQGPRVKGQGPRVKGQGSSQEESSTATLNPKPFTLDPASTTLYPSPSTLDPASRGFDIVIGNPPYIRIQVLKEWAPAEVEHYKSAYQSASKGNYDIYVVFVERGLSLLNKQGRLGFILPHKFFNAQYGESLRGVLSRGHHLAEVIHFGDQQVFAGATTYTTLLFLEKQGANECRVVRVKDLGEWRLTQSGPPSVGGDTHPRESEDTDHGASREGQDMYPGLRADEVVQGVIPASSITAAEWNFTVGEGAGLFEKLSMMSAKLGDVADIFVGLQTSADKVFILEFVEETRTCLRLFSKALEKEWLFEKRLFFPMVSGTDVLRYGVLSERQYVLFPYKVGDGSVQLLSMAEIGRDAPKTAEYLLQNRGLLEQRENGKMKGTGWHGYIYLKNMTRQSTPKICVPRLVDRLYAAFDEDGRHYLDNVDVGGVAFRPAFERQGFYYLLGLLNSSLLRWFFPNVSAPFRGGWMSANRQFLSRLPIRLIDFTNEKDKQIHDKVLAFVKNILELHRRHTTARTDHDKTLLQRQIAATDKEIDRLVYDLYGLTDDEIAIVEGGQ